MLWKNIGNVYLFFFLNFNLRWKRSFLKYIENMKFSCYVRNGLSNIFIVLLFIFVIFAPFSIFGDLNYLQPNYIFPFYKLFWMELFLFSTCLLNTSHRRVMLISFASRNSIPGSEQAFAKIHLHFRAQN